MDERLQRFKELLDIMDELRENCPWDRKQTLESLRYLTIEETYELSEAILEKDMNGIKKELGDLMLHIVFYSKIASESLDFTMADVLKSINEKLIERHPHVFGETSVENEKEVRENWEKIKIKNSQRSVLQGVPKSLPALVKAFRIQEKASGIGFDWDNPQQVWDKVQEELKELQNEVESNALKERKEAEFGDLLFALINYARFIDINPEDALERTNKKFIKRFKYIEEKSRHDGKSLDKMSLEEMDVYWENAKKIHG